MIKDVLLLLQRLCVKTSLTLEFPPPEDRAPSLQVVSDVAHCSLRVVCGDSCQVGVDSREATQGSQRNLRG